MGRGIFSGESQPSVVDVDQLIGGVDGPDEAALIGAVFHSPCIAVMARAAKSIEPAGDFFLTRPESPDR